MLKKDGSDDPRSGGDGSDIADLHSTRWDDGGALLDDDALAQRMMRVVVSYLKNQVRNIKERPKEID